MGVVGGYAGWQGASNEVPWSAPSKNNSGQQKETKSTEKDKTCRSQSGLTASTSQTSQILESIKLLSAGGCAGAISKSCTAPLARMTILYQVQALHTGTGPVAQLSLGSAFQHIIRQEGLKSLWKGNGVTILHRLPFSAINFWAYERTIETWNKHISPEDSTPGMNLTRRLVAGGLAGSLACTAAYPLDLVRTRLSAQLSSNYYQGIGNTLKIIARDEGARGLYRGLGATLMQVAPSLAINYAAYETFRAVLIKKNPQQERPTMIQSLACGSAAGLISSTLTFPLDLVRRRMQLEGQRGSKVTHTSIAQVFRGVYRKEGWRGFYHGILPEYYKVVPGVAIAFCVYEVLKSVSGVEVNKGCR